MSTPLKLQKIVVKGLFDLFDHEIPLNQNEGVTVMLGPNGFGKTAILRMVYELLSARNTEDCYAILNTVFQALILYFSDGQALVLKVFGQFPDEHNRISWLCAPSYQEAVQTTEFLPFKRLLDSEWMKGLRESRPPDLPPWLR